MQIMYNVLTSEILLSFIIAPIFIWMAKRLNIIDHPNHRKKHVDPTPYLGGAGILFSLILGLIWYSLIKRSQIFTINELFLLISISIIFMIGLLDDIRDISPLTRIIIETLAAMLIMPFGFLIESIWNPFGPTLHLGIFSYPITLIWLLGVTNAFNLIDGIDGSFTIVSIMSLAGSIGLLAVTNQATTLLLPVLALGALIGFLYWNWNGAKVFIGDSGALMIGFICASIAIKAAHTLPNGITSIIRLLSLCALPLLDLLVTIFRRALTGQSWFIGDRRHIHHMLMEGKGLKVWQAAMVLGFIQLIFSSASFLIFFLPFWSSASVFLVIMIAFVFFIRWLGYSEFQELVPRLKIWLSS